MPHIHTEPGQHDHTVTAYIIRIDRGQPRALLHMHKKLGKLMPPGGHIELNETPWDALAHELREETGYELDQLMVLQPPLRLRQADLPGIAVHPQPLLMNTHDITADHFHSDTCYALTVDDEPRHGLADGESTDVRWLTRDEMVALAPHQIWPNVQQTYLALFDQFLTAWQPVPATDFILGKITEEV